MRHPMGRKLLFPESVNLSLPEGTLSRLDAVRQEGETRLDLIRAAIDLELERRGVPKAAPDVAQTPEASGKARSTAKGRA